MRKNDLIKILESIKGNPEVVLWNGSVGDYQHIKGVEESSLVKETWTGFLEDARLRECIDNKDWDYQLPDQVVDELHEIYKKEAQWSIGQFVTEECIKSGHYKEKRVLFIEPKKRDLETFDRNGLISY